MGEPNWLNKLALEISLIIRSVVQHWVAKKPSAQVDIRIDKPIYSKILIIHGLKGPKVQIVGHLDRKIEN